MLTNDLEDTINSPDITQEVVSKSSTRSSSLGKSSNIDDGQESRNGGLGLVDRCEPVNPVRQWMFSQTTWELKSEKKTDLASGTATRASSGSMVALQEDIVSTDTKHTHIV